MAFLFLNTIFSANPLFMSVTEQTLTTTTTCKNCETTFEGRFCPNCAQKADTHRFTLKHFAHEVFHAVTHTDKGIIFLMKELFRRPGKVTSEYVGGKRKKYFNPITFLLIMIAVQIYVSKKTDFFAEFTRSISTWTQQMAAKSKNPEVRLKIAEDQNKKTEKQVSNVLDNNKLLTFLFIPVLSILTWLFFKKSGYNYVENLILNILVNGELTLIFLVFAILPFVIWPSLVMAWMLLYWLASWIYTFIAYKQFFKQRWFITIAKGLALQILYVIFAQQFTNLIIEHI
jgi:hypothetical protein